MRLAAAALVIAAAVLVLTACGTADFDASASFADAEAAFDEAGLQVCSVQTTEARPPGAEAERAYDLRRDCADDDTAALVVVTAYGDEGDRDAAITRYHAQGRPSGVLWTLGPLTLRVSGDSDTDAVDDLTDVLDQKGAE